MTYALRLNNNSIDTPLTFFAEDEDGFDTEIEDSDSLDEDLGSLESDDDPGIEWRNDGEYEE